MQLAQIIHSFAVTSTSKHDRSLNQDFFYLEKLVANYIDDLNFRSLLMLMYAYDKQIMHSLKLLLRVQQAMFKTSNNLTALRIDDIALVLKVSAKYNSWFLSSGNSDNLRVLQKEAERCIHASNLADIARVSYCLRNMVELDIASSSII